MTPLVQRELKDDWMKSYRSQTDFTSVFFLNMQLWLKPHVQFGYKIRQAQHVLLKLIIVTSSWTVAVGSKGENLRHWRGAERDPSGPVHTPSNRTGADRSRHHCWLSEWRISLSWFSLGKLWRNHLYSTPTGKTMDLQQTRVHSKNALFNPNQRSSGSSLTTEALFLVKKCFCSIFRFSSWF